ncbi:olfactory receptor 1-like [Hyla sarda]|uniref:olfactory receptor 1-like n=1 Tax=Hyla sarda TaxID=327740 RepID=UPI0024C239FE|nr:olfactory receptor 1-like [Hyla sarda]
MAFDRYLAICYPLRYSTLMSPKFCFHLAIWSWAIGFIVIPSEIFLIEQLEFCTTDKIDHIFCDLGPILEISSTDTSKVALVDFVISIIYAILPFVLIIISYICISVAIIKITSSNGRRKAFSACRSHLALVCAYYGPLLVIYIFPIGENTPNEKKVNSLVYMAFTPLMNPVLHSMRNQEIKKASQMLFCKSRVK